VADALADSYGPVPALLDDAELIVSELITNAVQAGSSAIALGLDAHVGRAVISVTDDVAQLPRPRESAVGDVGGRGLAIVAELAQRWGTDPAGAGKTVWADLRVPRDARVAFRCDDGATARPVRR